ncbi:LysR family transcriptional regulator [Erwiniaceae bacterium BAC15a-03b]|uniref:LysR family transcriptional regulator n=1 Tax=Winslowiella arboricola TaxID=2978220 RepID=A0A9J6PYN6_9GAMM|nr:LysR family transcriptional regulator [Winslowiella arboricola]MCU5774852.1 LysR family transcriptional regulator [Winslowiella arboricola]MCU5779996.1 LysR family transcriptional regulator [Winslowiella arboricola]
MNALESLSGLTALVKAVETGSFIAASERLGVSASAVGKSVARLENSLGVSLLNRSTRSISLTDEGALFYERARRIVAEIEEAQNELSRVTAKPSGRLRVSLPAIGYRMLLPLLPQFIEKYQDIELDLDFSDRLVDVIAEGVDVVVRSGSFNDSQLRAKRLGSYRFQLVASPAYLARRGIPHSTADLVRHACLRYRFSATGALQSWQFSDVADQPLPEKLVFTNLEALISAAVSGLGLVYVPDFAVAQEIKTGKLVTVLDETISGGGQFSLLWPGNRHLLPKLRVFIDFIHQNHPLGD